MSTPHLAWKKSFTTQAALVTHEIGFLVKSCGQFKQTFLDRHSGSAPSSSSHTNLPSK
jgi:hypothetical protein